MKLVGECRLAVSGQRLAPPTSTYAYSAMVLVDADNLLYPPEHYKINGKWQESAAGEVGRQRSDVTTGARSEVTKRNVATRRRGDEAKRATTRLVVESVGKYPIFTAHRHSSQSYPQQPQVGQGKNTTTENKVHRNR